MVIRPSISSTVTSPACRSRMLSSAMIQESPEKFSISDCGLLIPASPISSRLRARSKVQNQISKSLYHSHYRAALGPAHPLDFIHEAAHQEVTAARSLHQIFCGRGVGHCDRIEARALIAHFDLDCLRRTVEGHFNLLCVVFLVAVNDRVGNGFAYCHVDPKSCFIREPAIAREISRRGSSVSNSLNVAGQNESSRLFGHKRHRPPAMGIAVWLLTIQKQTEDGRVTCGLGACQCEPRDTAGRISASRYYALRFLCDHSHGQK